uniref:Uncharacterized protein n=1 Tax=Anguilla anguilla TaxID=7936 RepID=A0A0E9WVE3_ANGAN
MFLQHSYNVNDGDVADDLLLSGHHGGDGLKISTFHLKLGPFVCLFNGSDVP